MRVKQMRITCCFYELIQSCAIFPRSERLNKKQMSHLMVKTSVLTIFNPRGSISSSGQQFIEWQSKYVDSRVTKQ